MSHRCHVEQAIEQMIELPVIWDAMALMWRHCNALYAPFQGKGTVVTYWLVGEMNEEHPDFAPTDDPPKYESSPELGHKYSGSMNSIPREENYPNNTREEVCWPLPPV